MGRQATKFTVTVKHPVKYRFKCEQCGQDSGWQEFVLMFTEEAQADGRDVTLTAETQLQLYDRASKKLESNIAAEKKKAEKHKYSSFFSDKCRSCKKRQSWGVRNTWLDCVVIPFTLLFILTVILCVFSAINKMWALYAVCGVFAASFVPAFIYVLVRSIRAAKAKNKQLPEIDWNGK